MFRSYPMALTAILMLGLAPVAHAQQSAKDSARAARDVARDQRTMTTDTMKLHRDIAMRDSVHSALLAERSQRKTNEQRLDSLQAVLEKARKATPRDPAAIKSDEAAVKRLRDQLDRERDRDRRLESSLKRDELAVRKESHATIDTHRDIRGDQSKKSMPQAKPKQK